MTALARSQSAPSVSWLSVRGPRCASRSHKQSEHPENRVQERFWEKLGTTPEQQKAAKNDVDRHDRDLTGARHSRSCLEFVEPGIEEKYHDGNREKNHGCRQAAWLLVRRPEIGRASCRERV